jgi:hypothetical protein
MRTKTLLLTAALTAAGASASMAQTIYSVNAVGYVNLTLPTLPSGAAGPLAMIANPLNGTNNFLNTILPLPPSADGTTVFFYDTATANYTTATFIGAPDNVWLPDLQAAPGTGFFIQAQNSAGPNLQVTFVGEVPQGTLVNTLPPANQLALKSSIVPQSAPLGNETTPNTLLYPAEDGDTAFIWNQAGQSYDSYTYVGAPDDVWLPGSPTGPVIDVARGFFIQKGPTATKTSWTRTFSVN